LHLASKRRSKQRAGPLALLVVSRKLRGGEVRGVRRFGVLEQTGRLNAQASRGAVPNAKSIVRT
jgi:hypothetical protein